MASPQAAAAKEDVWIKTYCHGCLSAMCAMLVHRVDGVIVGLKGDPDNPYNEGKLCAKAYAHIMTLYDPYRPTTPLIRTNPEKGIGVDPKWKAVSWEEALDLAAAKLAEIRKTDPTSFYMSTGDVSTSKWNPGPILASFGSPNYTSTAAYYCASAVHTVPYATMATWHIYPDFEYCNYLVLWGSNKGGMIQHVGTTASADVADARMRGMRLVSIDPVQSNIAAKSDEWVPILPGTDLAMALAWLHVLLIETGIYDQPYLKEYTNGPYLIKKENGRYIRDEATQKPMMWDPIAGQAKPYDATFQDVALEGEYQVQGVACKTTFQALKEHVQQCTPEWAAPITTISAATIRRLAREFGDAARIGSTITIEGHVLPWRPAAIHWYAGISQHTNGYITSMALQMINTVVGNLHVPGGVVGEGTILDYPYGSANLWSGRDSMPTDVDGLFFPSLYARGGGFMQTGYPARKIEPPKTHSAGELFPLSLGVGSAVLEANSLHPESFNHKIPLPKVMLGRHASDMTNKGNPQEMAQILGKIFQISCEPLIDETAEFADIFFPAPMRLERLQVGASFPGYGGATLNLRHFCVNLAQPVLPSPTREMLDIWSELAERLGILSDFNRSINVVWDLQGPYRLESDRKYTYRDMQERFAQSVFGPEYDLEYLAKAGHIKWRKSVRERYPRTFLKPRSPIYYEHFIEAGEQLGQLVQELGFDFDLTDHKPLPAWRPGPAHKESNPKFDLYSVPFRVPFLTHMWLTHNPWLVELAEHHPWAFKIVMNATTAAKKGIKDGDHIVVEGSTGYKVEGIAKLTQCIHPEVVALSRHGGHWCSSSPIAKGKGTNFNALVPHTMEYIDPVFGSLEGCVKVSVSKTAGG